MSSIVTLSYAKHEIVTPALTKIGLASSCAINLVSGTGDVESGYIYTRQLQGGPALGFWQMEPETHDDCWINFLRYRSGLKASLLEFDSVSIWMKENPGSLFPSSRLLESCPLYAAAMCRVKYFRSPKPLPSATCALALSLFHKDVYNTSLGKADPYRNVSLFQEAINA